jgi:hypothetical protein
MITALQAVRFQQVIDLIPVCFSRMLQIWGVALSVVLIGGGCGSSTGRVEGHAIGEARHRLKVLADVIEGAAYDAELLLSTGATNGSVVVLDEQISKGIAYAYNDRMCTLQDGTNTLDNWRNPILFELRFVGVTNPPPLTNLAELVIYTRSSGPDGRDDVEGSDDLVYTRRIHVPVFSSVNEGKPSTIEARAH